MLGLKLTVLCLTLQLFSGAFGKSSQNQLLPDRDVCGKQETARIFGGTETKIGEFPWMALIKAENGPFSMFICGGALINKRYVMTAGHCILDSIVSVRLGEHNIKTKVDCDDGAPGLQNCADPPVDIKIQKPIRHENYNPYEIVSDIALLRLEREVEYTDFIRPICLPMSSELREKSYANVNVIAAGWGKTESAFQSDVKLKVEVPVIPERECNQQYGRYGISILPSQICAGKEAGKSTCNGDSGGPLMFLDKTQQEENWIAVGTVSFGLKKGCALKDVPTVYTRVSKFVPWILNNIEA